MKKETLFELICIKNLSYAEIGKMYNITGATIKKTAIKFGIQLPIRRKISSIETFNKGKTNKSTTYCKNCNNEISYRKTFCNHFCQHEYSYKLWLIDWKNGKESGIKGDYGISNHLKRFLFEKFDNKCSNCGWSQVNSFTGKIPLEIEHIDGNFMNNNEDNLTLLCPNCHSLTSTYKGANLGNGRKERKKYK